MKNLEIALCDFDSDYIILFANQLMERAKVSVHIFTTTEGFFADDHDFDVTILTEEFEEISKFRPQGSVGHKYILCEKSSQELSEETDIAADINKEDCIYKYQAVDLILEKIQELRVLKENSVKKSTEISKLVGVYSPTSHELQLPFAMALGKALRTGGKVLFIDLEEISIMSNLMGKTTERNLMDLLYEINTNSNVDISKYVRTFMGFDYIEPFINPNEIGEIDEDTWSRFFEFLYSSEYDVVVILFGRAINGFTSYLGRLSKLYVLGRPGDYFRMSQERFLDYLERISLEIQVENVILPMSAGNLSDGTYQIEELLQGNLGVFVKKLLSTNIQKVQDYYG